MLALDVVLWLLALPMALRIHGVPILLKRLAADAKQKRRTILELEAVYNFYASATLAGLAPLLSLRVNL